MTILRDMLEGLLIIFCTLVWVTLLVTVLP